MYCCGFVQAQVFRYFGIAGIEILPKLSILAILFILAEWGLLGFECGGLVEDRVLVTDPVFEKRGIDADAHGFSI